MIQDFTKKCKLIVYIKNNNILVPFPLISPGRNNSMSIEEEILKYV